MTVLAIDPGSERSAWVLWDGQTVLRHGIEVNVRMLFLVAHTNADAFDCAYVDDIVVEKIASYGMPVGAEVFDTEFFCGRLYQAAFRGTQRMPRRDVKLHLCGQARAKDANIRQALIDRFGGKDKAIGKKSAPGPLYGIKADEWQALALAVTWHDLHAACAKAS